MRIRRSNIRTAQVSLVSMIDALMILLIFFMVTSTYFELGMIPMVKHSDDPAPQTAANTVSGGTLLIRLAADGTVRIQGQPQSEQALSALLSASQATKPPATVMVLPSGAASAQSLVSLLDVATVAGVKNMRILRLEALQ